MPWASCRRTRLEYLKCVPGREVNSSANHCHASWRLATFNVASHPLVPVLTAPRISMPWVSCRRACLEYLKHAPGRFGTPVCVSTAPWISMPWASCRRTGLEYLKHVPGREVNTAFCFSPLLQISSPLPSPPPAGPSCGLSSFWGGMYRLQLSQAATKGCFLSSG